MVKKLASGSRKTALKGPKVVRKSRNPPICGKLAAIRIEVPNQNQILRYLKQHHGFWSVVSSVCGQARQEFGNKAQLTLELYRDPEIHDNYLRLRVRLPSYGEGTMARLDRVTEPFDEALCRASGYLLVTTDFRPPQVQHAI